MKIKKPPYIEKNQESTNEITFRQYLIAQVAPFAICYFFDSETWSNYDELAGSLVSIVDSIIAAEHETRQ